MNNKVAHIPNDTAVISDFCLNKLSMANETAPKFVSQIEGTANANIEPAMMNGKIFLDNF